MSKNLETKDASGYEIEEKHCDFCKKSQKEVKVLICGDTSSICNECVDLSTQVVKSQLKSDSQQISNSIINSPQLILDYISRNVIGQDDAKRIIANTIYIHHQRSSSAAEFPLPKSNIILIGPTGVGKTFVIKTVSSLIDVPYIITSATAYTQTGYAGDDTESMLAYLLNKAEGNLEKAQRGIIFVDEIDKIARTDGISTSNDRDVSGVGVQQALLTLMEGAEIQISTKKLINKNNKDEVIAFNTSNILFIFAGAFVGIENKIENRMFSASGLITSKTSVKTGDDAAVRYKSLMSQINTDDIINYGFIPEFIGRINEIVKFNLLNKEEIKNIIISSKSSPLDQYKKYFSSYLECKLEWDDTFVDAIVELAFISRTGARGVRTVLDRVFGDIIFMIAGRGAVKRCVVSKDCVILGAKPLIFGYENRPLGWVRDTVFIGYSRKDKLLYADLRRFLIPLERNYNLKLWSDENILPGTVWKQEIEKALGRAKIAIFLVSADFLASEIAFRNELEYVISISKSENIEIVWALLSDCLFTESPLANIQAIHDVNIPINKMKDGEKEVIWKTIAAHIKHIMISKDK